MVRNHGIPISRPERSLSILQASLEVIAGAEWPPLVVRLVGECWTIPSVVTGARELRGL